jgi:SAM-dependent methyltransferase
MRKSFSDVFRHPITHAPLGLEVGESTGDEVITGVLRSSEDEFPIVNSIARFVPAANYAESFGRQWLEYSTTQLDSRANWNESRRRLFEGTQWPEDLHGQRVLEAGAGMGRFTEVLAQTGASICSFDLSRSIEAGYENNQRFSNVLFAQADILNPPFELASFDKVLCIGVLQHCPSPRNAFLSLCRFVKPGGEIFIDIYRLNWRSFLMGKYYLRPLTRRLPLPLLRTLVRYHVGWVYPTTGVLHKVLGRPGRVASTVLSVADYRGVFDLEDSKLKELALLDTFDALSPAYDRPATVGMVRRWFESAGFEDVQLSCAGSWVKAKGRRPRS